MDRITKSLLNRISIFIAIALAKKEELKLKTICRWAIVAARSAFGSDKNLSDWFPGLFKHLGYLNTKRPKDVGEEIKRITEFAASVQGHDDTLLRCSVPYNGGATSYTDFDPPK